jgi:hypothetical protein
MQGRPATWTHRATNAKEAAEALSLAEGAASSGPPGSREARSCPARKVSAIPAKGLFVAAATLTSTLLLLVALSAFAFNEVFGLRSTYENVRSAMYPSGTVTAQGSSELEQALAHLMGSLLMHASAFLTIFLILIATSIVLAAGIGPLLMFAILFFTSALSAFILQKSAFLIQPLISASVEI